MLYLIKWLNVSLSFTLKVGKTAVLLDRGRLSRQPPILSAHTTAHVNVVRQLRPHCPSVRNEVELIKQSRLIPGRQRAARRRHFHFHFFVTFCQNWTFVLLERWTTCPVEWASATPRCFSPTGCSALGHSDWVRVPRPLERQSNECISWRQTVKSWWWKLQTASRMFCQSLNAVRVIPLVLLTKYKPLQSYKQMQTHYHTYLTCSFSLEPKVILGMSQARQNSRVFRPWAATEQPTVNAAATFSPFGVGGLEPAERPAQKNHFWQFGSSLPQLDSKTEHVLTRTWPWKE